MKDFAKKYIAWYDALPLWAKIVLCLLWAIPAGLYRLSKSVLADNTVGIVLAILVTFFGGEIVLIIDIVTLAMKNKIFWLDEISEVMSTATANDEAPAEEKAEETPATDNTDAE